MQGHAKPESKVPMAIAAIVAVIGSVSLFVMDFGPWNNPPVNGMGMISAAVVYKAGAIALPSAPAGPSAF